jgi:DNA polymerase-3 subunit delta'
MADDALLTPDDLPLPREQAAFHGHAAAETALREAAASGRLHHAWLIGGPAGIGKATLAYRLARYLLAARDERSGPGLAVDPASRTARQVAAGSHPNLITLDLETASADVDRPPAKSIPVKTARRALSFFGTTAADGGHRICIVDSAEDLTPQAANALLKTVEEPPARAVLLIVSHAPQRVMATIRSRCRKLILRPLPADDLRRVLSDMALSPQALESDAVARAIALSDGSVRHAVDMLDEGKAALVEEVTRLLDALPTGGTRRVLDLAERLASRQGDEAFALALDAVQRWLSNAVARRSGLAPAAIVPLAEASARLAESAAGADLYNLDRRPLILSTFEEIGAAIRKAS